jgi:hypothetical protein
MSDKKDSLNTVNFSLKSIIIILAAAWTPAILIGGSLLKWGNTMDYRMTVQEQTAKNINKNLAEINTSVKVDIRDLRRIITDHITDPNLHYGLRKDLDSLARRLELLENSK